MVAWKTNSDTIPLHTVLVVSDQQNTVAMWDTLFNQRNCILLPENNVHDALQTARLIGPSLLLIDMPLSKKDRTTLISGFREASTGSIILLVNANTVQEVVEANQAGADECLVKPVNPAVLVVKATAWLGHGHRVEKMPAPLASANISV